MLTIALRVVVHTPLHIGTANANEPASLARDSRGHPCLPAVTFKGVHRATTVGIAAALGFPVCTTTDVQRLCQPIGKQAVCVICRLFGSPWLAGALRYHDLLTTATPRTDTLVTAPQSRRRRIQIEHHAVSREVLPAGLIFTGQIDHLIHDPALLALAVLGLRAITAFGASKATGCGLCTVEAKALDQAQRPVSDADLAAALQQAVRQLKGASQSTATSTLKGTSPGAP